MEVKDDSNTSIVCIALAVSDLHTMIDRVLLTCVSKLDVRVYVHVRAYVFALLYGNCSHSTT